MVIIDITLIRIIDLWFLTFGSIFHILVIIFFINRIKGSVIFENYINYAMNLLIVPFSIILFLNFFIWRHPVYIIVISVVLSFLILDYLVKKRYADIIDKREKLWSYLIVIYYSLLFLVQYALWTYSGFLQDWFFMHFLFSLIPISWFVFVIYVKLYEKEKKEILRSIHE